jgi:hypothetical protein
MTSPASTGTVTCILVLVNLSAATATFTNSEDSGNDRTVPPSQAADPSNAWIPWCDSGDAFGAHHMELALSGRTYAIWQHRDDDGDHVRYSTDGKFYSPGTAIPGNSATGQRVILVIMPDGTPKLLTYA